MIDSTLEQAHGDADDGLKPSTPVSTVGADPFAPMLAALERIGADLLRLESAFAQPLDHTHRVHRNSASNLVHYLALRQHDLRELQEQLAAMGLSSLGRTESHVLAGLDAVRMLLCRLTNRACQPWDLQAKTITFAEGQQLLRAHTAALLGPRPSRRGVRIMVTMPTEAAQDYALVKQLLERGMDCMRINCAHDDRAAWAQMVAHLRRAQDEVGRQCRVLMDVAGPKLRTGPIAAETQVVKWAPQRDGYGRVAQGAASGRRRARARRHPAPHGGAPTQEERPPAPPSAVGRRAHIVFGWVRHAPI
ncbi:MAG TPA: pyruvate kinase [Steroidobacteraceae bacterium]|nr:pyruvate kinase [Steroidobacteraceae bacterium]